MRGLVQFIADLRNARARELEEKRINKELANIRSVDWLRVASSRMCILIWVVTQAKIQRFDSIYLVSLTGTGH